MSNMGKGAGYYLTRSKSLLIDTAIVAILAIFMSFAMQMDTLQSKGEDYLVLMLYAVIFGLTSLQSGAMIVDLTAKDKLSRRIEFFAASGIAVKEIIKQYSIQIFRFSGIIPFLNEESRFVITCQNDGAKPNDIENILSSKGGMLFLTVLINGNGGNIQYLEKDGILTATAVLGRKNEDITI